MRTPNEDVLDHIAEICCDIYKLMTEKTKAEEEVPLNLSLNVLDIPLQATLNDSIKGGGYICLVVRVPGLNSRSLMIDTPQLEGDSRDCEQRISYFMKAYTRFAFVLRSKTVSDLKAIKGPQDVLNFLKSIPKEDGLAAGVYKKNKKFTEGELCCRFLG